MKNRESSSILISVVVCTYNRADLLRDVLQTLSAQKLDSRYYEVLVVDNNSSDNTSLVSGEFCRRYPNFNNVQERKQGLSHARNRGWREAKGEYVAYIDDDCKIPEDWLRTAVTVIEKVYPDAFGGPFFAFYNTPKPRWYKDSYGSHNPFSEAKILNEGDCVNIYGGNMFFRRSLLQLLGGFDASFGMSGNKIAYGEETALLKRISTEFPNERIYFDPVLFVYHLVQAKKMALPRIIKQYFIQGGDSYRVFEGCCLVKVRRGRLPFKAAKVCAAFLIDLFCGTIKRDRKNYPYIQNYFYEHSCQYIIKLGRIYEMYRKNPLQS